LQHHSYAGRIYIDTPDSLFIV